jgi:hypothetical protein
MDRLDTKKRILDRALEKAGGLAGLARRLEISEGVLKHYANGGLIVPDVLLLQLLDIVEDKGEAF